jgi:hypothetical protein
MIGNCKSAGHIDGKPICMQNSEISPQQCNFRIRFGSASRLQIELL